METTRFDAAEHLSREVRRVAYLAAALESGDASFIRDAVGIVARARGTSQAGTKTSSKREEP
jgi:probable addiction module antidote protein